MDGKGRVAAQNQYELAKKCAASCVLEVITTVWGYTSVGAVGSSHSVRCWWMGSYDVVQLSDFWYQMIHVLIYYALSSEEFFVSPRVFWSYKLWWTFDSLQSFRYRRVPFRSVGLSFRYLVISSSSQCRISSWLIFSHTYYNPYRTLLHYKELFLTNHTCTCVREHPLLPSQYQSNTNPWLIAINKHALITEFRRSHMHVI